MNNFKNFVIFLLSLIVLIQSALLVYFISRKPAVEKPKETSQPAVIKKTPVKEQPPVVIKKSLPSKGKIAIVLDDWSYTLKNKNIITDNDFHVTIAVLPFRAFSGEIARLARQKGKDVIVHMPMEPHNKDNYELE
ncbi:MAG TPA: divergent polysaccharide deacetylase family protein, partial [Candidatus Omnitrophota bacterium]|nr:divergent polysaccharide deacetylase family protein [Candidatus Omnitrophota bacterium]